MRQRNKTLATMAASALGGASIAAPAAWYFHEIYTLQQSAGPSALNASHYISQTGREEYWDVYPTFVDGSTTDLKLTWYNDGRFLIGGKAVCFSDGTNSAGGNCGQ